MKLIPQFLTERTRHQVARYIANTELDGAYKVTFRPTDQRTIEQNDKIQAMCGDIARQVGLRIERREWANVKNEKAGEIKLFGKDNWRHILMAGFTQAETVPGLEQGQVVCLYPSSTSLSLKRGSDFIDYIYSVGAEYEVKWSEPENNT